MEWMEIHQDMGERFKIKLTMRLSWFNRKKKMSFTEPDYRYSML
jgi:hypothetical protein